MLPEPFRQVNRYHAFLNIPYDSRFESMYLAYIAGLCGFGLIPKAALEIPSSQRRLDIIIQLINGCAFSFHDLSCIEPRFNMPFELGLAVVRACKAPRRHAVFVFEAEKYRIQRTLSDLNGTDVYIHDGNAEGLLYQLTNVLERSKNRPTVNDLLIIYKQLEGTAKIIRDQLKTKNLFDARPFKDLVYAATSFAHRRIATLQ
jgi:hypothetical protein